MHKLILALAQHAPSTHLQLTQTDTFKLTHPSQTKLFLETVFPTRLPDPDEQEVLRSSKMELRECVDIVQRECVDIVQRECVDIVQRECVDIVLRECQLHVESGTAIEQIEKIVRQSVDTVSMLSALNQRREILKWAGNERLEETYQLIRALLSDHNQNKEKLLAKWAEGKGMEEVVGIVIGKIKQDTVVGVLDVMSKYEKTRVVEVWGQGEGVQPTVFLLNRLFEENKHNMRMIIKSLTPLSQWIVKCLPKIKLGLLGLLGGQQQSEEDWLQYSQGLVSCLEKEGFHLGLTPSLPLQQLEECLQYMLESSYASVDQTIECYLKYSRSLSGSGNSGSGNSGSGNSGSGNSGSGNSGSGNSGSELRGIHTFLKKMLCTDYLEDHYFTEQPYIQAIYGRKDRLVLELLLDHLLGQSSQEGYYSHLMVLTAMLSQGQEVGIGAVLARVMSEGVSKIQRVVISLELVRTVGAKGINPQVVMQWLKGILHNYPQNLRVRHSVEEIALSCLDRGASLQNYIDFLPFYRTYCNGDYQACNLKRDLQLHNTYQQFSSFKRDSFLLYELECKKKLIELILSSTASILPAPPSPVPMVFNYIFNSPIDNQYIRTHLLPYLQRELIHLCDLSPQLLLPMIQCVSTPLPLTPQFYSVLNNCRNFTLLTYKCLRDLSAELLHCLMERLLKVIQQNNHPLIRQQIQLSLCRVYMQISLRNSSANPYRQVLIDLFQVNINIAIPVGLCLGYEMLFYAGKQEINRFHEVCVGLVGCHTAYLRGLCQEYLRRYLKIVQTDDSFLNMLVQYWQQDRDSVKMLTNISLIIDSFQRSVEQQEEFLGFERVQQYPSNRAKMVMYQALLQLHSVLLADTKTTSALRQAVHQRTNNINQLYQAELSQILQSGGLDGYALLKSNTRTTKQHVSKVKPIEIIKGKKGKEQIEMQIQAKSEFQCVWRFLKEGIEKQLRRKSAPQIIIIASLLQKLHNFGHIIRTMNHLHALVLFPSEMPMTQKECMELIPPSCDVQVAEIKPNDLPSFILRGKEWGYRLVALEQCSRSVQLGKVEFPKRMMLLLGNQRKGTSGQLLSMADVLVEIPQSGQVRSLNVHVSMALCIWEYIKQHVRD